MNNSISYYYEEPQIVPFLVGKSDYRAHTLILTFSRDLLMKNLPATLDPYVVFRHKTLNSIIDVYEVSPGICIYLSPITSGAATMVLEEIASALKPKVVISFGSCGALTNSVSYGDLILPVLAVRDDGLSDHYLPRLENTIETVWGKDTIVRREVYYHYTEKVHLDNVWTTNALYRETRPKVDYMVDRYGCNVVDMEVAALQAVSRVRKWEYYPILFSLDSLSKDEWDSRGYGEDSEIIVQKRAYELAYFIAKLYNKEDVHETTREDTN